jgi:1,4-dihydroxy-2-naphthoate polyprenyltransferase
MIDNIYKGVLDILEANCSEGKLSLASNGRRISSIAVSYSCESFQDACPDIKCTVIDSMAYENIRSNPRVSFSLFDRKSGKYLTGNGIAHIIGKSEVELVPYRFQLYSECENNSITIEKYGSAWMQVTNTVRLQKSRTFSEKIRFGIKAIRAVSLFLTAIPVAIGSAAALYFGKFDIWLFFATLAGILFANSGVNLISDYNDYQKGYDKPGALSSHPSILAREETSPEKLLLASLFCFSAATFFGGLLIASCGWPVFIFMIIGAAGGYFYTGGPAGYKYKGFGELAVSFLLGPILVMASFYTQARALNWIPFILSLPAGLITASVTLANNTRDIIDDRASGIRTLPMIIGIRNSKILYVLLIVMPYLCIAAIAASDAVFNFLIIVILSIPAAVKAVREMVLGGKTGEEIRMNAAKYKYPLNSIRLHRQFNLLLLAGILLYALINRFI